MNEEQFIEEIKKIKIDEPDEYFFLEFNKAVFRIIKEKEQLKQERDKYKSIVDGMNEHIDKCLENDKYCYLSSEPKDKCRIEIWGEVKDKIKELEEGKGNGK